MVNETTIEHIFDIADAQSIEEVKEILLRLNINNNALINDSVLSNIKHASNIKTLILIVELLFDLEINNFVIEALKRYSKNSEKLSPIDNMAYYLDEIANLE